MMYRRGQMVARAAIGLPEPNKIVGNRSSDLPRQIFFRYAEIPRNDVFPGMVGVRHQFKHDDPVPLIIVAAQLTHFHVGIRLQNRRFNA